MTMADVGAGVWSERQLVSCEDLYNFKAEEAVVYHYSVLLGHHLDEVRIVADDLFGVPG